MPYDRDSFLAGLAVGRTLWRPHRDYGEVPEPWGWDLIEHSTQMVSRCESNNPDTDYYFGKGDGHGSWWGYQANASVPAGYNVNAGWSSNASGMFVDAVVPARFNRLLVDVYANGRTRQYNTSGLYLIDGYGLSGIYWSALDQVDRTFSGTVLRSAMFTSWYYSVEELNNQEGVTLATDSQWTLTRQTVEIDISDLHQDLWVGFQRCDCEVNIYSIRAF